MLRLEFHSFINLNDGFIALSRRGMRSLPRRSGTRFSESLYAFALVTIHKEHPLRRPGGGIGP